MRVGTVSRPTLDDYRIRRVALTPDSRSATVPRVTDTRWQHPWLRVQRLIRSILEVRRDPITRPVMKATLTKALREREQPGEEVEPLLRGPSIVYRAPRQRDNPWTGPRHRRARRGVRHRRAIWVDVRRLGRPPAPGNGIGVSVTSAAVSPGDLVARRRARGSVAVRHRGGPAVHDAAPGFGASAGFGEDAVSTCSV